MPYGITQCNLPTGNGDILVFTPAETGIISSASQEGCKAELTYNDNNNNNYDNIYGAVIMTKVIARVHPVHLMNVD